MKNWTRWGSFFMLTGVLAGAFGAHALKDILSDAMKAVYETAVRYQLIHGLALLLLGELAARQNKRLITFAAASFCIGIFLFSGSLYLLALTGTRSWGIITPVGGLAFLAGWASLLIF